MIETWTCPECGRIYEVIHASDLADIEGQCEDCGVKLVDDEERVWEEEL